MRRCIEAGRLVIELLRLTALAAHLARAAAGLCFLHPHLAGAVVEDRVLVVDRWTAVACTSPHDSNSVCGLLTAWGIRGCDG